MATERRDKVPPREFGNNREQALGGNDVRRKPRPINGHKKKTRLTQQCSAGAQIESRSWIKIRVFSTLSLLDGARRSGPFALRSTRRGHARAFVALWPYLATSWEATRCAQRKRRQQHGPPFHRNHIICIVFASRVVTVRSNTCTNS